MYYERIEKAFNNRVSTPEGFSKPSAVLVPIVEIKGEECLLLTQRALHMKHQPGDFCFPGGHSEGNETSEETAIRETWEELGIPKENIKIIGPTDFIITTFGAYVKPFVARIENFDLNDIKTNPDEVEKVVFIPLDFFMNTAPRDCILKFETIFPPDFPFHLIVGGKDYKWGNPTNKQSFYDYKGDIIWGITAKIINNVKSILKSVE